MNLNVTFAVCHALDSKPIKRIQKTENVIDGHTIANVPDNTKLNFSIAFV